MESVYDNGGGNERPQTEQEKKISEGQKSGYVEWIRRGDQMFIPSEEVKTADKVEPGLYSIRYSQNIGFYLFKENYKYDEILTLPTDDVQQVVEEIDDFWTKGEKFKEYGLAHKRGILLHGKQGTGKSSLINLIVTSLINDLGGIVLTIKSRDDLSNYASFMPQYFKVIEPNRPVVTIIEDLDGLLEYSSEAESMLLNMLDGLEQMEKTVYIATTNYPEKLKARILNRPSRFDIRVEIKPPNAKVRKFYFLHKLKPHDIMSEENPNGHDIDKWVELSDGLTMAHLREMIVSIVVLEKSLEYTIAKLRDLENTPSSSQYGREGGGVGYKKSTTASNAPTNLGLLKSLLSSPPPTPINESKVADNGQLDLRDGEEVSE